VKASNVGGVFSTGDKEELARLLARQLKSGRISKDVRKRIEDWSKCLDAESGARYLIEILDHQKNGLPRRPAEPWHYLAHER
jgi:hypothetical protein